MEADGLELDLHVVFCNNLILIEVQENKLKLPNQNRYTLLL